MTVVRQVAEDLKVSYLLMVAIFRIGLLHWRMLFQRFPPQRLLMLTFCKNNKKKGGGKKNPTHGLA